MPRHFHVYILLFHVGCSFTRPKLVVTVPYTILSPSPRLQPGKTDNGSKMDNDSEKGHSSEKGHVDYVPDVEVANNAIAYQDNWETEFTPEEQKHIIRRIDRRLVTTVGVMYCVSLMDRFVISRGASHFSAVPSCRS